ncbi:NADH dehydrogenase [ubiquinone] 1 alpha subcomplex assembly factor 3 [Plodia interpunctella]|uniref:NADH dehydrogenase [ubiquinone] 1 alpha subcomplex assembly factor 3 n=1 Tax=Plodia interpunctella TaxID=58824 RepID=UPI002368D6CF|nr:NADH dehydrogenase [ubiquinone] 1 alpha subcomplex assembly factor 3 [Plodia interpunctella]
MLANRLRHISIAAARRKSLLNIHAANYAKAAYDGEGKTTVRVLNMEPELGLMIDSYATYGFRLNNGVTVLGPIAIFPRTVLSWQVRSSHDITEESLKLFKMLEPSIDILIVGLESKDRGAMNAAFRAARALDLNVELLSTDHACSTFNFLNAEGRSVAGACIPPLSIELNEDDMLQSRLHYDNLFNRKMD